MSPFLDEKRRNEHRLRNLTHSVLLIGGIGALLAFCAWLIWGWPGVAGAFVLSLALFAFAPSVPADTVMRMYGARRVDPRHGGQLARLVEFLADRAELPAHPKLYVVPSMTLNAFATGRPDAAAIALTEGLLRRLDMREVAGVIAHEISHIRNNDLRIMGLADTMSRITQMLSYVAVFLVLLNLPGIFTGELMVPWLAIVLLYLAPTLSSLLQLGLSRTREYDADLEGAMLTGDPVGLASALRQLERYQGNFWEDLIFPGMRRIPQPSLLRSHPTTAERIARLMSLKRASELAPFEIPEQPMVSLVGFGPIQMRPRYRWTGVWY